jgi:NAD dependent epimerase/dehydratase family enzyme
LLPLRAFLEDVRRMGEKKNIFHYFVFIQAAAADRRKKHNGAGFMVKWVLGEFGSVIPEGQRVIPRWLLEIGFIFQYLQIDQVLQS